MAAGVTKLANVVDPQVFADMVEAELKKKIKLAPLADVDDTLVGVPGSELTVPKWSYIGDATDVAEGEAIPIEQLGKTEFKMKVKKAGKGVEITDEALLSGYGDPLGEGTRQLALAIASKIDDEFVTALATATQTSAVTGGLTVDNLEKALAVFDDEDDEAVVLVCNPANASELRMDAGKNWLQGSEIGADRLIKGAFGEILNTQVVRTRRVAKNTAYLIKAGALKLTLKRDIEVETDRDIVKKTTVVTADKHYGAYLYNDKLAVKVTIS
ncbi:MAG: N4-gp56 family major capsid protein [Peptostreptococcaceae bacterium]|nr:N4-gp56 family major capsid protein [Peptostreptococcaceae bacterium]